MTAATRPIQVAVDGIRRVVSPMCGGGFMLEEITPNLGCQASRILRDSPVFYLKIPRPVEFSFGTSIVPYMEGLYFSAYYQWLIEVIH